MADIFISYAREDQPRVKPLVRLLEIQGWSVFWDLNIPPGDTWRSWIGRHLDEARCVIVAWSAESIDSLWVQEEADEGIRAKKPVIPILLDTVLPPLGYRSIQAADFSNWDGNREASVAVNLLLLMAQKLGLSPVTEEQRKAEEEARRKRQEEAERLKAKEEAAKQEVAALDAKRKADEEKAIRAEFEAVFDKALAEATSRINEITPRIEIPLINPEELSRLIGGAPRLAIVEAWLDVEDSVKVAAMMQPITESGRRTTNKLMLEFKRRGLIQEGIVDAYMKLSDMHNKVAHLPDYAVSAENAERYIEIAKSLILLLRALSKST